LAVAPTLRHAPAAARPQLDSIEHDGPLAAVVSEGQEAGGRILPFGEIQGNTSEPAISNRHRRPFTKSFTADRQQSFPGNGQMKPERAEIARLKREVTS
jgi:hypothetical protein